ncbi:hypothetical protein GGH95_000078 [Coemansia sp. RSA 1836]|nr:hypothetical protein GGI00_000525 [Coemansia sp. RSA 2681]KAJ2584758.1 hypothetical protein GGH95_000078 [Coemansia sp. RSA 1836]
MSSSSSSMSSGKEYSDQGGGSSGSDSMHRLHPCKCSQCDPNYYTIPLQLLHTGNVEYVCRDCQFATQAYHVVQQHEGATGHRRWYNFPQ